MTGLVVKSFIAIMLFCYYSNSVFSSHFAYFRFSPAFISFSYSQNTTSNILNCMLLNIFHFHLCIFYIVKNHVYLNARKDIAKPLAHCKQCVKRRNKYKNGFCQMIYTYKYMYVYVVLCM